VVFAPGAVDFPGAERRRNLRLVLQQLKEAGLQEALKKRLSVLLEDFGLTSLAGCRADRLSGGERRKLEIARAMARPAIFFAAGRTVY